MIIINSMIIISNHVVITLESHVAQAENWL